MSRGLSRKRQAFVNEYLQCWNATKAAKKAGYSEKTAYSSGQRLLKKDEVSDEIDKRVKEMCMSGDEALKLLADQARGTLDDCMDIDKNGKISLNFYKAKEKGKLHLIKSITPTANGLKVELYSSQRALELIAKSQGLLTDQKIDINNEVKIIVERKDSKSKPADTDPETDGD